MSRVARQPDLFAALESAQESAQQSAPQPSPPPDKLATLAAMHARLAALPAPPWPTLAAAMEEEYRALALARDSGPEGAALAAAILEQTERLLAMTD
jgi:hypothetical protein